MRKIVLLIISVLLPIVSKASDNFLSSGPFYFSDGVVPPKKQNGCRMEEIHDGSCDFKIGRLVIPLTGLQIGIAYNISCNIENPNYDKPYPVVLKISGGSINGVKSPSNQYLLDHKVSKYATQIVYSLDGSGKGNKLEFLNFDNTDSVYVKDCFAIYSTQ